MKVGLADAAARVADELGPAMLQNAGATLIVIVCDAEGWNYSMRGERRLAVMALEAVAQDARDNPGRFQPLEVASA